ncbi:MAG: hypothetical protein MJZ55_01040 [Paludibacteraceae bacterium]|nr:hypothetical protein [Paludibacteraceae bacterium]
MKQFKTRKRLLRTAKSFTQGALFLLALLLMPKAAQANDYLTKENHYQIFASGTDKIHFKIPVWTYAKTFGWNYYAYDKSYVYYTVSGSNTKTPIAYYKSDAYEENNDNQDHGTAYVKLLENQGIIVITSMADGNTHQINYDDGNWTGRLIVKQGKDYDCPHVTWLEFDWFPPESLDGKKYKVGIESHFRRSYNDKEPQTLTVESLNEYFGRMNTIAPQLMTPFLQPAGVDADAPSDGGYAAIPYTVFNEPISYTTSLSDEEKKLDQDKQSGLIYVKTTDTVQPKFNVNFTMWRNKATGEKTTQPSKSVDILPYHRIYDFSAKEEMDSTGTYTGNNVLSWNIKNPDLQDIVSGDMFEIERALKPDFSDAQQLTVLPMSTDAGYAFLDESRATWTGNVDSLATDISIWKLSAITEHFVLKDGNGNPAADLNVMVTAREINVPAVPVYYRMRRASSSIWGWNKPEFAKTCTMKKHNFLAPLAETQAPYIVDADNHAVHFNIKIDNQVVPAQAIDKSKCDVSYRVNQVYLEDSVDLIVNMEDETSEDIKNSMSEEEKNRKCGWIDVTYKGNDHYDFEIPICANTPKQTCYRVPRGSRVWVRGSEWPEDFIIRRSVAVRLTHRAYLYSEGNFRRTITTRIVNIDDKLDSIIYSNFDQIKETLLPDLMKDLNDMGRSMWDRTAQLVLMRHITETGQTQEIIIPQDSIVRQADGSWIASFTDFADRACTHYQYSVRIDQSKSDLQVMNSDWLKPVPLKGDSLYFTEGADIRKFTATQGDSITEMKSGVFLSWEPTDDNYDEFILLRKKENTTDSPDTLWVGTDVSYMDRTAVPDQHYDYTVVVRFSCNGISTVHSADAKGWRTPYGEISGTIMMPDNTGIAGVTVTLESDKGETISQITTSTGAFKFDRLLYGDSTSYIVSPTAEYAHFSFNNTQSATATIGLSADNAVASAIDFVNTSTARITGRVLYKNTTIPVSGAMFLLNGDTVRRGNAPLTSGVDGNFEMAVTKGQTYTLQVFKPGHKFEGNGILQVEEGIDTFAIDKPLDGIRFYDMTKVRLIGRVAGGNDQRDLKHGFGLGKNNLGDDLQLVLQIEGDNTARFVFDPNDPTRDTVQQQIDSTRTLFEKKRVIIHPDPKTGEYAVDLFPIRYKVIQATAKGYATLFASGQGSETFDLTNALTEITDSMEIEKTMEYVRYHAIYDRIYHTPMQVALKQMIYGLTRDGLGEPSMEVTNIDPAVQNKVDLYTVQEDGTVDYLLGYPVYNGGRRYQFKAEAYEDYYYNNVPAGARDRVPLRGGSITIHNGLHDANEIKSFDLDDKGVNSAIWLDVDNIDVTNTGDGALRSLSISLEQEGNTVETNHYDAYIAGIDFSGQKLHATPIQPVVLDVVRDPGGAYSTSWIETGSTYNYAYTESFSYKYGLNIDIKKGTNVTAYLGMVAAPEGAGTYQGTSLQTSEQTVIPLPLTASGSHALTYTYSFTTSDRISTSSSASPIGVGALADVFYGTTVSQLSGKAQAIAVIDDSLYQMRQPALEAGVMKEIASGVKDGKKYHLVTGQQIILGSTMENTFAYSQYHILYTILPELILERQNLLMTFNSREEAQAAANASGEEVYWYHPEKLESESDTLPDSYYDVIVPEGDGVYPNRVKALDNMIYNWLDILVKNEEEKVRGLYLGKDVGTYSVSSGANLTHSDTYASSFNHTFLPNRNILTSSVSGMANVVANTILKAPAYLLNEAISKAVLGDLTKALSLLNKFGESIGSNQKDDQTVVEAITSTSKFTIGFTPVLSATHTGSQSDTESHNKSVGFSIVPDPFGEITVLCRQAEDTLWNKTEGAMMALSGAPDENRYGSYIFYTQGGVTSCPHEEEEVTQFYNPGTKLSNGTEWKIKPEMSADTYEITNVQPENRAVFRIKLMNNAPADAGIPRLGNSFSLYLNGASNPNGAKVYANGSSLIKPINYWLTPGEPVYQTIEVERGQVDDYENLSLELISDECQFTGTSLSLSVHFLPKSSDVNIASPKQNWVMNTLSPRDSIGYYLPIDINGFDIYHKNFDHIEFQYKLATESEDMWVNQCSFYASDSLYNLATGNKAMIENGTITPFRFYGERDPMEQKYDLRAVAYCRYGSGFVTQSSPIISGTKDTRPPRVFGQPEPANAILGVGDNLKLRYNEPIAGNYLDEDANFSIIGVTNRMGITASTSIGFDGSDNSYAETKTSRNLSNRSFSVDMIVKPASPNTAAVFFQHGQGLEFGITADNRLYAAMGNNTYLSKPVTPMLAFTRVAMVYEDRDTATVLLFYVGSALVSDTIQVQQSYKNTDHFIFGKGFKGNMLEARVWTKALSQAQINETNFKYLTGYERDLLAYYPMSEGYGSTLNDDANGATLYCSGHTWTLPDGISLRLNDEQLQLDGNSLGRNDIQDETLMFWFKTAGQTGTLFSTAGVADRTVIAITAGTLTFRSGANEWTVGQVADDNWHQIVIPISRSYNVASIYLDDQLTQSISATDVQPIAGAMYFGGDGFVGNIDEFAIFEQALPASLCEQFRKISIQGDEMGLMAYLPFEQLKLNSFGILELVFSVNDQREIKDKDGNVGIKQTPLIVSDMPDPSKYADKAVYAPVRDHDKLTKFAFDWAFNGDELLINLKMLDNEINKRSIYVTVRDVEDLNGNPMVSPVTWTAFVDRNALKWNERRINVTYPYGSTGLSEYNVDFTNLSGERHQYIIESLDDWLTINAPYGSMQPMDEKTVRLMFNTDMAVGTYDDIIYLTDEDGMSEPLYVTMNIEAIPPYEQIDESKYPDNMSICAQVKMITDHGVVYDTDPNDIVYAFCDNECVGMENISFNEITHTSNVFMTVFGTDSMVHKPINFQLWQASTGKIYDMSASISVLFANNHLYGCNDTVPLILSTSGSETQAIELAAGWNWVSVPLILYDTLATYLTTNNPWMAGDIIKSPSEQIFAEYSAKDKAFKGTLNKLHYSKIYMIRVTEDNIMRVAGDRLPEDSMKITVRGDYQWSVLPCLFESTTPLAQALTDYYDYATPGDMVKAHNRFAVFTSDRRWEGNLTALRPGEGYMLYRQSPGSKVISFYPSVKNANVARRNASPVAEAYTNPNAATNMTMIAQVEKENNLSDIRVYVGGELAAVSAPITIGRETYFFLTIQSDQVGEIRFEMGNETLEVSPANGQAPVRYAADAHAGSVEKPIMLRVKDNLPYKIIENDHVVIIRNNKKYDVTGQNL